jgi:hypothetical protein
MSTSPTPPIPDVPFVNEMRLNCRQWSAAILLIAVIVFAIPRIWKRIERFETGPDYRIPYSLSKDYWLYNRRLQGLSDQTKIVLLGDSVVWGEYVLPEGSLSHFLNQQAPGADRFINGGVNGLFPLALEGLVHSYAKPLHRRKIILHCNLLWMSSPKADLQTTKEEKFNHSRLVPQFSPRIPCYKTDANERLSVVIERNVQFLSWVSHLQSAYFGDKSIPVWTLQDDGNDPPSYTNSYKNPLKQITLEIPTPAKDDPLRGPASPRHKAWTENGGGPTQFEWVTLESSLQWAALQRTIQTLRSRGNDVFLILGPFNEHMIATDSQPGYTALRDGVKAWLEQQNIPMASPEILPSSLYADASHPLTQGYQLLAKELYEDAAFQKWIGP